MRFMMAMLIESHAGLVLVLEVSDSGANDHARILLDFRRKTRCDARVLQGLFSRGHGVLRKESHVAFLGLAEMIPRIPAAILNGALGHDAGYTRR